MSKHAAGASTLDRAAYVSPAVFERERERLFHRGWMFVGHAGSIPAGSRRVVDVAGESVVVTRDRSGRLHAFANVCRHRGAQLCAPHDPTLDANPDAVACAAASLRCPYHAWTYSLDGRLRSTPRVDAGEVDRDQHALWAYRADEHNGLVFVDLSDETSTTNGSRPSLTAWLGDHAPGLAAFDDLRLADMVAARRTTADVAANWKIIVENYQECLHCAVVHPELVDVVPLYRSGHVVDPDRDDGAVAVDGNSFSLRGHEDLPLVPGLGDDRAGLYRGAVVFPNGFVDVTGTSVSLTALYPLAPDRTLAVSEYLFAPDATDQDAIAHVIDFNELVGRQDYVVCEGVQRGVSSTAFTTGVLTSKDSLVREFDQHYRSLIGPTGPVE